MSLHQYFFIWSRVRAPHGLFFLKKMIIILSILAIPISNSSFGVSEIFYDINSNFEVLSDELDIGLRVGLVNADFANKYSNLLMNMAEEMEEECKKQDPET